MISQAAQLPTAAPPATPIAPTVLENLAARLRPSGVCLIVLRPDGSVAWHDPSASLFFQRFALPILQYPDSGCALLENVQALTAASPIGVWNILPGVVLAAFPYVERRQVAGVLLLA